MDLSIVVSLYPLFLSYAREILAEWKSLMMDENESVICIHPWQETVLSTRRSSTVKHRKWSKQGPNDVIMDMFQLSLFFVFLDIASSTSNDDNECNKWDQNDVVGRCLHKP